MHTWQSDISAYISPRHQGLYPTVKQLFSIVSSQEGTVCCKLG